MARNACPVCGVPVKAGNLHRHMTTVHPRAAPVAMPAPRAVKKPAAPRRLIQRREGFAYAIFGIAIVVIVAFALLQGGSGPGSGTPAPDFHLIDIDGVSVSLEDCRGEFLLLDLMSTSCSVCQRFTDETLVDLYPTHGQRVRFLSVDINREGDTVADGNARIRTFKQAHGTTWQYALDTDGAASRYQVSGTPTTVLVSPEGNLLYRHVGFESLEELRGTIDGFVG